CRFLLSAPSALQSPLFPYTTLFRSYDKRDHSRNAFKKSPRRILHECPTWTGDFFLLAFLMLKRLEQLFWYIVICHVLLPPSDSNARVDQSRQNINDKDDAHGQQDQQKRRSQNGWIGGRQDGRSA